MSDVRRDAVGVPHLRADDVMELARLQGRVTALDRGWQIEHHRWRMEGRTAEYVGPAGLPWDRFSRQVLLEPTVRRCFERLDAETQTWLTAYVSGVNDALAEGLAGLPEIEALGLHGYAARPRPWEPWTPLGIFWGIHLLFGTFPSKLFNAHVADRLGEDVLALLNAEGVEHAEASGSNAWVIGGHRTAGGLPLIAGDPHRTIELPGCYQQVGLACPEFDVVGFTFPGVPGVQHFAHTGTVAWGITNAMADYQDLTLESLRHAGVADDGSPVFRAKGLDGWEEVQSGVETIRVRGEQDVTVPVAVTARGPVVTGLEAELGTSPGPAAYSLRTPTQVEEDLGFGALLPLLRARTVDDVEQALAAWVEPVNSALVADVSGRMRHLVVGRVPERDPAGTVLPLPAWDARHEWHGYRRGPATEVRDVMVSANDRASGGGLGVEYATPFRAERIRDLIGERNGLTAADCAEIHVDTRNGQAELMRELVEAADVHGPAADVRAELLAWDGHSDAGSRGAAVFAAWRTALVRWFAEQPALAPLHEPSGHSSVFLAWTDVTTQIGVGWHSMAREGSRIGIDVAAGVRAALERVAAQEDPATVWGDRHWLDPLHALATVGGAPTVAPDPVGGDKGCVLAAASAPGVTDRCYGGPAARYVWDLADREASRWVVPFGTSGDARDPHFADQTPAWLRGDLHPVDASEGTT
ncbi:penicillin acylase family protein [Terrabacter sp. MAHUQ-38]|uniref:penicillin acylase family protein n=1 Tax=unclassified Terrabacter TaxID=2630222 RepID=UPI00165E4EE7|nr:penicillin acylase family protein [Terrabacter sp. MAHUQ-38]